MLFQTNAYSAFDYTVVNSTRLSEALCQDFNVIYTTNDANELSYIFRQGSTREADDGVIIERTFDLTTLTWDTGTQIYAKTGKDCTGPHGGTIGSTDHIFINCKESPLNTDGILVWGTRTHGSGSAGWSFSDLYTFPDLSTGSSSDIGSVWGRITETGIAGKYFIGSSRGGTPAIQRLITFDSGITWAINGDIISSPSKWSEFTGAYAGNNTILGIVRDDNGANVAQVVSTDSADTWSTPALVNLGQPTGVKVSFLIYDEDLRSFVLLFVDRAESPDKVYISITDRDEAIAGRWNPAIQIDDSGFGDFEIHELDSASKKFIVFNPDSGNGSCDLQYVIFQYKFPYNNFTGATIEKLSL